MTTQAIGKALATTLDDEYRARATYQAVLEKFGSDPPFANIVEAEERHVKMLLVLFPKYGITPPADRWNGQVAIPDTLVECCQAGVDAEICNYSLYDGFLNWVQDPDIRFAFTKLRDASEYNHLPAFQRCVERSPGMGPMTEFNPSHRGYSFSNSRSQNNTGAWVLGGVLASAALIYFMRNRAA